METADNPLRALAEELQARDWRVELTSDVLTVINPAAPRLNDQISFSSGAYQFAWGQTIGKPEDLPRVADRIQYVLREVGA